MCHASTPQFDGHVLGVLKQENGKYAHNWTHLVSKIKEPNCTWVLQATELLCFPLDKQVLSRTGFKVPLRAHTFSSFRALSYMCCRFFSERMYGSVKIRGVHLTSLKCSEHTHIHIRRRDSFPSAESTIVSMSSRALIYHSIIFQVSSRTAGWKYLNYCSLLLPGFAHHGPPLLGPAGTSFGN